MENFDDIDAIEFDFPQNHENILWLEHGVDPGIICHCIQIDDFKNVKIFLNFDISPNITDHEGNPSWYSVKSVEILNLLITYHVDFTEHDRCGKNALLHFIFKWAD
jgi:hypothetical protein